MHITFRSGPGNDRKIIKLLVSDQAVEVMKKENEWALVRLPDGREGWVLHRYLTTKEPCDTVLARLQSEHATMLSRADTLEEENDALKKKNATLTANLQATREERDKTNKAFGDLKKESAAYLELKSKYEKTAASLSKQNKRADALEDELTTLSNNHSIKWFLSGAGILILGVVMGLISRPKKQRSSLL
ncbi:MAG: TIGR04211 family SH3 domain-containing protein [Deltaproteobacteria bacterium]|nr:TIGR04211 family SH3 domain-containing protein [Deltaproteobacteria bacterium]